MGAGFFSGCPGWPPRKAPAQSRFQMQSLRFEVDRGLGPVPWEVLGQVSQKES